MKPAESITRTFSAFMSDLESIFPVRAVILHGSAVLGDFREGKGDLDFMVITMRPLTDGDRQKLFKLHKEYRAPGKGILFSQLEGIYYPLEIVETPFKTLSSGCYIGTSRKGWGKINSLSNSFFDLAIIRKTGLFFKGEELRSRIHEPSISELHGEIKTKFTELLSQTSAASSLGWAVSAVHFFTRSLCFLAAGKLASKTGAVTWFLEQYPGCRWKELLLFCKDARYPYSDYESAPGKEPKAVCEFLNYYKDDLQRLAVNPD